MTRIYAGSFKEKTETPTEEKWDFTSGKFTAKRVFEGPWANRYTFMEDELVDSITDIAGETLFSVLAPYPDNPIAIIANVSVVGKGVASHNSTTDQAQWERAVIEVEYSTLPSGDKANQNPQDPPNYAQMIGVEESGSLGGEVLSIPGEDIKVQGGQRQHDQGPFNFAIPLGEININFPRLSRPNFLIADILFGFVNDTAFITPGGRAIPKEHLLFQGYDCSLTINVTVLPNGTQVTDPTRLWNVTYKFGYNVFGWNHKLIDGVWQRVVRNANNLALYSQENLYQLFFGPGNYGFSKSSLDGINTNLEAIYNDLRAGNGLNSLASRLATIRSSINALGFNV